MAFFHGVDGWGVFPIAVNVKVLIMEPCRRVVPFSHLDRVILVGHVNDIQPIGAAVGVVVLWNGVKVAVGQLVIDQNPIVVGRDLDVDHASDFGVIRREQGDVVGL